MSVKIKCWWGGQRDEYFMSKFSSPIFDAILKISFIYHRLSESHPFIEWKIEIFNKTKTNGRMESYHMMHTVTVETWKTAQSIWGKCASTDKENEITGLKSPSSVWRDFFQPIVARVCSLINFYSILFTHTFGKGFDAPGSTQLNGVPEDKTKRVPEFEYLNSVIEYSF